jgi:transposase
VAKCLSEATELVNVEIRPEEREVFIQETPGRPGPNTRYRKERKLRFDIVFDTNHQKVEEAEKQDGVFPLVTNDRVLSEAEVLATYKRQAQIEKRFSQLKTQFEVAPVFLKSVQRVVALLTIYYLALLVQALLEREIRLAMAKERVESLPLYHEERNCKAPTTRRIIDLFENIQRHELLSSRSSSPLTFATELSELQQQVLHLLRVPESDYDT